MGNEKTKYSEQEILNYSVDDTVAPPILQFGGRILTGTGWARGGGLGIAAHDYVSRTLTTSTKETYEFKSGGSTGTTVATVVIDYTDSTLNTISAVTRT